MSLWVTIGIGTGYFNLLRVYRSHLIILNKMENEELARKENRQSGGSALACVSVRKRQSAIQRGFAQRFGHR